MNRVFLLASPILILFNFGCDKGTDVIEEFSFEIRKEISFERNFEFNSHPSKRIFIEQKSPKGFPIPNKVRSPEGDQNQITVEGSIKNIGESVAGIVFYKRENNRSDAYEVPLNPGQSFQFESIQIEFFEMEVFAPRESLSDSSNLAFDLQFKDSSTTMRHIQIEESWFDGP
jgi:hypothetical protein